jgi:magnesium transporter
VTDNDSHPVDTIPTTPETDVRTRVWRNGVLEAENFPFEQFSDYLAQEDCLVWADICAPDQQRLNAIADELSLDPHAIEDATSPNERPKAIHYATHTFFTAYSISFDEATAQVLTRRVSAFAVPRGFVTVRERLDFDMDVVVARWDQSPDLIKFGPKGLAHGLLDLIVDGYFTTIGTLDDEIEATEDHLFEGTLSSSNDVQRRSYQLRKSLVLARKVITPMREVVNLIARFHADDPDLIGLNPYYTDLYDHVLRATEWTESLRDLLTTMFETNLSLADARLNTIMKKLTAWAAIIAVPTAVTGFYGQNVPYPGFDRHWGFWVSSAVIVGMALGLYATFRRRDWI